MSLGVTKIYSQRLTSIVQPVGITIKIMTVEFIPHEITSLELFRYYIKSYGSRKESISLFLESMKIKLFFLMMPSIREVETLIHVAKLYGYSSVSEKMGIKKKTVEKNIMSIKSKMISAEMFGAMLEMIRKDV